MRMTHITSVLRRIPRIKKKSADRVTLSSLRKAVSLSWKGRSAVQEIRVQRKRETTAKL